MAHKPPIPLFIGHGHSVYKLVANSENDLTYKRYDNDSDDKNLIWIFKTPDDALTRAAELNKKYDT